VPKVKDKKKTSDGFIILKFC